MDLVKERLKIISKRKTIISNLLKYEKEQSTINIYNSMLKDLEFEEKKLLK